MKEMVEGLGLHKNALHEVFFFLFSELRSCVNREVGLGSHNLWQSSPSQISHRVSVDVTSVKERGIILFHSNTFHQQNKEKCRERILQ